MFTIQWSTLATPSPTTADVWCVCVCVFVTAVCSFPSLQFGCGSSSRPQWFSPVDTTKCELMGNLSTVQRHTHAAYSNEIACAFEHVFMLICMSWTGLCTHPYGSLRIFSIPCDLHVTCMWPSLPVQCLRLPHRTYCRSFPKWLQVGTELESVWDSMTKWSVFGMMLEGRSPSYWLSWKHGSTEGMMLPGSDFWMFFGTPSCALWHAV